MKNLSKYDLAPEYPRIPHLSKDISKMTHDDIEVDKIKLPISGWVQEKIDGAGVGISWLDTAPVLRNRDHVLKKGYSKIKTPAKKQFVPAWNWIHKHEKDIKLVSELWESPVTIYGEWMFASHSIKYDKLPDTFIAYDIWSVVDNKFLNPEIVKNLLSETNIEYIKPFKMTFTTIEGIVETSEMDSLYRDGKAEGIVIKTSEGYFVEEMYKVVNKFFERREDFNSELIKNKYV